MVIARDWWTEMVVGVFGFDEHDLREILVMFEIIREAAEGAKLTAASDRIG
jgi:hypothetical protein